MSKRLSKEELAAIRERAAAAHPGEWRIRDGMLEAGDLATTKALGEIYWCKDFGLSPGHLMATGAFIAASRTDIPRLLSHAEDLESENRTLRAILGSKPIAKAFDDDRKRAMDAFKRGEYITGDDLKTWLDDLMAKHRSDHPEDQEC